MSRRKRAFTDETLMLRERGLPKLVTTSSTSTTPTSTLSTSTDVSTESSTSSNPSTESTSTESTSTGSSTTGSSTTDSITSSSSTASSITSSSSSLSSITPTASISPPSGDDNPYIFRTHALSGTVFIAVGAVAGFIFMMIFLWWAISSYLSYKRTKRDYIESMGAENKFHRGHGHHPSIFSNASSDIYSYGGEDEKLGLSRSSTSNNQAYQKIKKSKVGLFGNDVMKTPTRNDSWESLTDAYTVLGHEDKSVQRFNPVQDEIQYNRRSLFISPTVEVMNMQQLKNDSNTNIFMTPRKPPNPFYESNNTPSVQELSRPEDVAMSPERTHRKTPSKDKYHRRNKSSLSMSPTRSPTRSPNRSPTKTPIRNHRKTPSMYLEDLLDDNF
ncbi:Pheromone-regulated membrane protein 5 [Nakaseomyces bracarensis]|uniref:Pheromone-regulated membrane protein 5 n=1 Tax=Nakaseomyces bracarensis TaxID=273131 RepID=A0ABR4NPT3_9SACH